MSGSVERETGIEPATNSLEGCDSTTELLPPSHSPHASAKRVRLRVSLSYVRPVCSQRLCRRPAGPESYQASSFASPHEHNEYGGGEGRIRTSEATRATDLQSVAFDRSATSPKSTIVRRQITAVPNAECISMLICKLSLSFYRMVFTSITDPNLLNRPAPVKPVRTPSRPPTKI